MKKILNTKRVLFYATFLAFFLTFASCNDNKSQDTKEIAEEHNDDKFTHDNQEDDAQFLVNAAEINIKEIQLAQLAQQNGKTAEVRELGKMMEDAHTKSQNELIALANSKKVTIPSSITDDAQDTYKELNEKRGDGFDKAYVDLMVNQHDEVIEIFEDALNNSYDYEIKNWARSSLPDLRKHQSHAQKCQNKFDNL